MDLSPGRLRRAPALTRFLRKQLKDRGIQWLDVDSLARLFDDNQVEEHVLADMRRALSGESFCVTQFQATWWAELLDLCCEDEEELYRLVAASCTNPYRPS